MVHIMKSYRPEVLLALHVGLDLGRKETYVAKE